MANANNKTVHVGQGGNDMGTKSDDKEKLPKLPHGQGSFSYDKGMIRFRKTINGKSCVVYAKTVQECFNKMRDKEFDMRTQHENRYLLSALLQDSMYEWMVTFKKDNLKPKSYDTLESTYESYIKGTWLGRTIVENVRDIDIQRHLNDLNGRLSTSTVKKTYNLLNQFFNNKYARDLNNNPMNTVDMPRKASIVSEDDDIEVLSDEEIELLTRELSKPYSDGKVGYTHGYMILFIMWSFVRIGEALALQWKDIDFDEKIVHIYKNYSHVKNRDDSESKYKWIIQTPKTKKGKRYENVHPKALECLNNYKKYCASTEPDNFIFVTQHQNPVSDQYLNSVLKKALVRCGIDKHVTVHGLRHTGISYFIRHGVSDKVISELAGHSDVSITNKIYYNTIQEQKKKAFDNIEI